MYVFGVWRKPELPEKSRAGHMENVQTPYGQVATVRIEPESLAPKEVIQPLRHHDIPLCSIVVTVNPHQVLIDLQQ